MRCTIWSNCHSTLGVKGGGLLAVAGPHRLPASPTVPRGHVIKTPQWGAIQPLLSLASQAGVFLHLSHAALIYIPPAMTPLPILTHPPLLNTHRGPINPIMQMEVINRAGFSTPHPPLSLCLHSFLHVSHHATATQGFPAT